MIYENKESPIINLPFVYVYTLLDCKKYKNSKTYIYGITLINLSILLSITFTSSSVTY